MWIVPLAFFWIRHMRSWPTLHVVRRSGGNVTHRSLQLSSTATTRTRMPSVIDWEAIHPSKNAQFTHYPSRRSTVFSTKGAVAASQPLACQAGLEILNKGGNAADAAVATAAALNVTEPSCTGIGGDVFCLFYSAKEKVVKGINGSGKSPKALTIDHLRARGVTGDTIPLTDLNAVTVPGAASGWCKTIEHFGSGKLSMAEILAPAIRMAKEGVPCHELNAHAWAASAKLINSASENAKEMMMPDGSHPLASNIMQHPELAATFEAVAEHGHDGFYKGRIAQAIVDLVQSQGGLMTLEDLAGMQAEAVQPIKYDFRHHDAGDGQGVSLWECPPNGQGITALIALGIIEAYEDLHNVDILKMDHNSVEYLHVLIESLRLAFAARYYVTDPDVVHVPVKELLSKEYLRKRAELIDPSKAVVDVARGSPVQSSDTVYLTTSDSEGNACSFIASNYAGFGTGAIPKGCGFTLQNRGSGFSLTKGHPNELKGGKRPYHTIIPAMVTKGDDIFMSFGVMGGFMQPQGHVQVLLNVLRGFPPQAALDAPRFCISAGLPTAGDKNNASVGDVNSEVWIEDVVPQQVISTLKEMGHDVRVASGFARSVAGRGQIIQKINDPSGRRVWACGSDLRSDGAAVGQI